MAIGTGIVDPTGRGLPLLAKIFELFRLRVYDSLFRILSPTRLTALRGQLPPTRRLPIRVKRRTRALEASSGLMTKGLTSRVLDLVASSMEDWNSSLFQNRRILDFGEFELDGILDRLCIDRETFQFSDLHRLVLENGDVVLAAQIPCYSLYDESGLRLDEVGRQLGQLGLVAMSASNPTNEETFYLGSNASMEESDLQRRISKNLSFTGNSMLIRI